jgi:hypothetical protein
VIALARRIASTLALLATVLWVAFPAVIMASANPRHLASDPCPCCEGQAALGGVIGCSGCQVGTATEGAFSIPDRMIAAAWLGGASATFIGTDVVPADPPPRRSSVD